MIKFKSVVFGLVAMMGVALVATNSPAGVKASASGVPLSVKNYVPDQYDYHDYWGGIGDIAPEYGDGITTFAHITGLVPLKGDAIKMRTSFMLLSFNTIENGGDFVDGWATYSFSKNPGGAADNSFPYYAGQASGYFLHMTNFSGTAYPNIVEVQFVKSVAGQFSPVVPSFFVDNLVTNSGVKANPEIVFDLELVKTGDTYDLRFVNVATSTLIHKVEDVTLDESLFINELGQTFFSSAMYEGPGCDGKHWEHRAVKVYNFDAYTYDASNAVVTLDHETFTYDGLAHRPEVTVTIGDTTLVKDVDYYTEGTSVTEIGEGSVRIYFIGNYAGNPMIERTFSVVAINASNATVTLAATSFTHTGSAIEPDVTSVKLGDVTLVEGTDYTISYENNTAVGIGQVVITFIGQYSGTAVANFTITAVPSSEPTSEPVSEPGTSTPPTSETEEPATGCFGSVTATLMTSAGLLGVALVLAIKRRKVA